MDLQRNQIGFLQSVIFSKYSITINFDWSHHEKREIFLD